MQMKAKRRRHNPEFKAQIALEAMKGIKTIQQIAKENDLHPVQVSDWKKQMQNVAPEIFATGSVRQTKAQNHIELEKDSLHAKIGELAMHIDFLKKKCKQLGISTD